MKELRLRGISDAASANAYMPEFMVALQRAIGCPPACDRDLHRPLAPHEQLADIGVDPVRVDGSIRVRVDPRPGTRVDLPLDIEVRCS